MSSWINYQSYEKGGIGAELMNFFLRENAKPLGNGKFTPRTLHDFLDNPSCELSNKRLVNLIGKQK